MIAIVTNYACSTTDKLTDEHVYGDRCAGVYAHAVADSDLYNIIVSVC